MKSLSLPILILFLLAPNFSFAKPEMTYPASYYNELGIKYGENADFDKAIDNFQRAIQINSKYTIAYVNLGIIYGKIGEYDKAIENLKRAAELNPHLLEVFLNLGTIYAKKSDYDKAIDYAQKVISLDRYNAIAIHNLGYAYLMQGNKNLALEQYKKLKEMKQDKLADRLSDEAAKKGIEWEKPTVQTKKL